MKNKAVVLLLTAFIIMLTIGAFLSGEPFSIAETVNAEQKGLSLDGGVYAYATSTGNKIIRLYPTGRADITENDTLALRLKVSNREVNKSNTNDTTVYMRLKLKNVENTFALKKEDFDYDFISCEGVSGKASAVGAGSSKGALFALPVGQDGTFFLPVNRFYSDGVDGEENSITKFLDISTQIEYVEVQYSSYRWDIFIGQTAVINGSYRNIFAYRARTDSKGIELLTDYADNVVLSVNGQESNVVDGKPVVALDGIGTVSAESNKLYFFDYIGFSAQFEKGYGITAVSTKIRGYDSQTKERPVDGYVFEGRYNFRTNEDENTSEIGKNPVTLVFDITVEKLVSLEVTGASGAAVIHYADKDDSTDGIISVAAGKDALLSVVANDDFNFSCLSLNGEMLPDVSSEEGYLALVNVSEDGILEIVGEGTPIDVVVEFPQEASVSLNGRDISSGKTSVNKYSSLRFSVEADKGYKCVVAQVVGNKYLPVTLDENGGFTFIADDGLHIVIAVQAISYNITYVMNGGFYEGEGNPSSITYFDVVELIIPIREGYVFLGWKIQGYDGFVTLLEKVEYDIVLIAEFEKVEEIVPETPDNPENPQVDSGCGCGGGCGSCGGEAAKSNAYMTLPVLAFIAILLLRKKRS